MKWHQPAFIRFREFPEPAYQTLRSSKNVFEKVERLWIRKTDMNSSSAAVRRTQVGQTEASRKHQPRPTKSALADEGG